MARIRSVHPGLFTDEAFVALSSDAQILLIGLWTEADDQGIFEWKPLTIKMRLRPAKDGAVEPLLKEMEASDCVKKYEINGRPYGAIRNFRKFQRPKFPNAIHPLTNDIRTYVGLTPSITEMEAVDEMQFRPNEENSLQMEDGGGRVDGEKEEKKELGAKARRTAVFSFAGKIIRLNQKNFDLWKKAFPNLELLAELIARDAWLSSESATDIDRKKWFVSTSKYLANRNAEEKIKLVSSADPAPQRVYRW